MRWIMLLPFSVKTTIKILILMIMLPHEAWVSAGLSEISKKIPVLHQCNSLWESVSTMLRCYLKQQLIPSMRFLRLSDMITSFISVGFFTSGKDIRRENTESWETNSEIHKEESRVRTFKKRMGCLLLQMPFCFIQFVCYLVCATCVLLVCYVEKNRAIVEHSEPR